MLTAPTIDQVLDGSVHVVDTRFSTLLILSALGPVIVISQLTSSRSRSGP